jgi:hypothetical protein
MVLYIYKGAEMIRSKQIIAVVAPITLLVLLGMAPISAFGADSSAPRIALDKAKDMLGKSEVAFIDVRTKKDYKSSDERIPGSVWRDSALVKGWASQYPKSLTLIVYCA